MNEVPKWVLEKLCCYDRRNPDSDCIDEDLKVDIADKDCFCDNCFYGRNRLANHIIELYEGFKPNIKIVKLNETNTTK